MRKVLLALTVLVAMTSCQKDDNTAFLLEKTQEAYYDMMAQYEELLFEKNQLEIGMTLALDTIHKLDLRNEVLSGVVDSLTITSIALQDALNESEALNKQLQLDLSLSQDDNEALLLDIAAAESTLQDALSEIASLTIEINDAYLVISDLNNTIGDLQSLNSDQLAKIKTMKANIKKKNARIARLRKRIANLKSK